MINTCSVAIVGAGYMASEHAKAFAAQPDVRLVGIFSRSPARAAALAANYPGMTVAGSVAELYERTRADLLVVAVSELSMSEVSRECFGFPWTVLLEKPAGYDAADAAAILANAADLSRRVFVALNRRSYASTRVVRERLNRISGARFIKVQDQEDILEARRQGRPELIVANWMFANAIHLIDYFRIFGRGQITEVVPVVRWNRRTPGIVSVPFAIRQR